MGIILLQRALKILKSKWFIGGAVMIVAAVVFGLHEIVYLARGYMAEDTPWDPTPRQLDGRTVFEEHSSPHPGHYTFTQKLSIASKVDALRMLREPERREKGMAEAATFRQQSPIGSPAPDFELETTDGEVVRLSDKRGRIAVFMFVAMTCPPARTQVELWNALRDEHGMDDIDMFFVYSRERHPGEPGYRDFKPTTTTAERMDYARMMAAITDVPIVVDPIDERTLKAYGMVPNAAFVVDRDGYIVFKARWSDVNKINHVINQLLAAENV